MKELIIKFGLARALKKGLMWLAVKLGGGHKGGIIAAAEELPANIEGEELPRNIVHNGDTEVSPNWGVAALLLLPALVGAAAKAAAYAAVRRSAGAATRLLDITQDLGAVYTTALEVVRRWRASPPVFGAVASLCHAYNAGWKVHPALKAIAAGGTEAEIRSALAWLAQKWAARDERERAQFEQALELALGFVPSDIGADYCPYTWGAYEKALNAPVLTEEDEFWTDAELRLRRMELKRLQKELSVLKDEYARRVEWALNVPTVNLAGNPVPEPVRGAWKAVAEKLRGKYLSPIEKAVDHRLKRVATVLGLIEAKLQARKDARLIRSIERTEALEYVERIDHRYMDDRWGDTNTEGGLYVPLSDEEEESWD